MSIVVGTVELTDGEIARFRRGIRTGPGCCEWTRERNNHGYGRFTIYRNGRRIRLLTHRLALTLKLGREPIGTRHTCDNPPCCRPGHLIEGSQAANAHDARDRGRGDYSGLAAHRAAKVQRMQARLAAGIKRCPACGLTKALGEFGVNRTTPDGYQAECRNCRQVRQRKGAST
jgi:hypothetical protein